MCLLELFYIPNYPGYIQKLNWALFPFYWLPVFFLVYASWYPFIDAWRYMIADDVVFCEDNKILNEDFVEQLQSFRKKLILLPIVFTLIVNTVNQLALQLS